MINQLTTVFLSILVLVLVSRGLAGEVAHLDLDGDWRLAQDDQTTDIPAKVPGCVHLDLLAAGKIPDPFFQDNEKKLQWVSNSSWTYSRSVDVAAEFVAQPHVALRCEGLDTVAELSINGQKIGSTDNMFRTYEFDVKPLLKAGSNSIKVTFRPIGPYIADFIKQARGHLSSVRGMPDIRKAPYSNGWDFGPKFLTAGIYKKIELVGFSNGRLGAPAVDVKLPEDGSASIAINAPVQSEDANLAVGYTLLLDGKSVAGGTATVKNGMAHADVSLAHPQLWWPVGMGAHPLYDLQLTLVDEQARTIDSRKLRIGLRRFELRTKTSTQPLRLAINGREFFTKGASWIPCDSFAPRVTREKIRQLLSDAVTANMNMIRCWGGGYYEEDDFYDACDEMGLVVWSEFKFACAIYPGGNSRFIDNVRAEVIDQVNRLRNHPCIAVWSGNNEVENCVNYYKSLSREDYNQLFHGVIGTQVLAMMPDCNYVGGSPEAGDTHNWKIWHGGASFEKYFDAHGWMTEFGFQAFPSPATIASFTTPEDRISIISPILKDHQRNGTGKGNEMILDQLNRYFQGASDFDSTIWLSQINQAMGVTMGIEHWRADWPTSSGALVWQLNDCWPGTTWSSIDYFGRYKALQYKLRDAFAPLMITARYDSATGRLHAHVCSDLQVPCNPTLSWRLTDTTGKLFKEDSLTVTVPAGTCAIECAPILLGDLVASVGRTNALLWLELKNDGQVVSRKTVWFIQPKHLTLRDPQITSTVEPAGDGFDVTLRAQHPALWVFANLEDDPDARWSDNFLHLQQGESRTIHLHPSASRTLEQIKQSLRVRSVFDLCEPDRSTHQAVIDDKGEITGRVDDAIILGTSAHLENSSPKNVGNWTDTDAELDWKLKVDRAGSFHVRIDLACPKNDEGSTIVITAGKAQVSGTVPATAGWTSYQTIDLGTVQLEKGDDAMLTLRATHIPHQHALNVRSVVLVPDETGR